MKKILAVLLMLITFPALAAEQDCFTTFYQTKNIECINELLQSIKTMPDNQSIEGRQAIVGFLAQIFDVYPKEKTRILSQETSPYNKRIYLAALYRAGLPTEAEIYAKENKVSAGNTLPALKTMTPAIAGENDLLIGAYMASGDTQYIEHILSNYREASDTLVSDAIRITLMRNKFGPDLTVPGREKIMMVAACEKYDCRTTKDKFDRLLTLNTAFWALQSLSKQDAGIKKTFEDFFEKDARLKRLLMIEETVFANYLNLLMASIAMDNNMDMKAALSIYEKLGSAEDFSNAAKKALH